MGLPVVRRHQEAEGLAEDLALRVAEGPLGGGVEQLDPAPLVGHDDRFEDPFRELAVQPLRGPQRRLGPLAVGDLPRQQGIGPGQLGGALLDPAFELVVRPPQGLLRPLARGTRAQGDDAVAQVVGQLPQELHLVLIEGVGLRGSDGQGPQDLRAGQQGDADHGGVAAPEGLRAPGGEIGIVGHIPEDRQLAGPDGLAHRAMATLRVGPGHAERLEIALLIAGMGNGAHRLRLIVLSIADPAEAIAGDLDDDAAELPEELGLVVGPDQGLVATAEGLAGPIDPPTFADLRRQGLVGSHQLRAPLPDLPRVTWVVLVFLHGITAI